jgi:quercetin dioxygenase-like cupin family protein
MDDVILKRFERPDEARVFEKGRFELVQIAGMTLGRAKIEHVGIVVSGRAVAAMRDGRVIEIRAGDVFYIAPGHDSWVVGDEPYVSLHLMGAVDYARAKKA